MEIEKIKAAIEAMLFSYGKELKVDEIAKVLELDKNDVVKIIENMKLEFENQGRGIEIIKVEDSYQLCTKKEYYNYIYSIFDNRKNPNLSQAALEVLAIIAYNSKITRAELESIRGVNSDGVIYKLLEYNLIEESGKSDAPGKPITYQTTSNFLRLFGIGSLDELPILPKYKLDENQQIVIDEIVEE